MNHVSRLVCSVFVMMATGCYSLTHGVATSRNAVYLDDARGSVDRHFKEEDRALYMLFGTINVYQPRLDDKISQYLRKGVKVANLKIETACTPADVLIGIVPGLFGILFSSRTVRYEGDVMSTGKGGTGRD